MFEIIKNYTYKNDAITSEIIPALLPLMKDNIHWIIAFFSLNTAIWICWEYIQLIKGKQKTLPIGTIFVQVITAGCLILFFPILFTGVLMIANTIADKLYDTNNILEFVDTSLGFEDHGFSLIPFKLSRFLHFLIKYAATLVFYVLGIWRFILLSIYFILAPFIFCLSLNPLYQGKKIGSFFVEIIQVACWPIIVGALMLSLSAAMQFFNAYELDPFLRTVESTVFLATFLWGTLKVPFITSSLIGGTDMSSLTTGTGMLAGALKTLTSGAMSFLGKSGATMAKNAGAEGLKLGKNMASDYVKNKTMEQRINPYTLEKTQAPKPRPQGD